MNEWIPAETKSGLLWHSGDVGLARYLGPDASRQVGHLFYVGHVRCASHPGMGWGSTERALGCVRKKKQDKEKYIKSLSEQSFYSAGLNKNQSFMWAEN